MSRTPTDLSNKTLAEIREIKASVCKNIKKAILDVVEHEESAYGIRLADLYVDFGRDVYKTECGKTIVGSLDCDVSVKLIGTEI